MLARVQNLRKDLSVNQLNKFYLEYVLFTEYGEHENAAICLSKAKNNNDLPQHIKARREMGFKLKKEKSLDMAKEAFWSAAEAGDPISQYELAKLSKDDKEKYQDLLKLASNKLIQAKTEMYRFYIEDHQYEKAFYELVDILNDREDRKGLKLERIPQISGKFKECNRYSPFETVSDILTGKTVQIYHPPLAKLLYESASDLNKEEQEHLYRLGTVSFYSRSIIALAFHKNTLDNSMIIKKMISAGRDGDSAISDKLIQVAMKGDIPTLTSLFEEVFFGDEYNNLSYVTKVMEAASISAHPLVVYTLGHIYTKVEGKFEAAERILVKLAPIIKSLAEDGNTLAQFYMGWIYEKIHLCYDKAIKSYGEAALNGSLLALYSLGRLYSSGIFLGIRMSEKDTEQGLICYTKCAELGYIPAQESLAHIALDKKDDISAMKWFEQILLQGYIPKFMRRESHFSAKEGGKLLLTLAERMSENKDVSITIKEWLKNSMEDFEMKQGNEKIQKGEGLLRKVLPIKKIQKAFEEWAISEKSQEVGLLQAQMLLQDLSKIEAGKQQQEKTEAVTDFENQGTTDKKIFIMRQIKYDNPRIISESIFDAQMNFVGKNISTHKTQMGPRHEKETGIFNEELRSFIPVKQPSLVENAPMVSLNQAAFLDEKLTSQAEYFTQTGFAFAALREAAEVGIVHMFGELPTAEEEGILGSALDWMGLSRLPENFLEDFSHLL